MCQTVTSSSQPSWEHVHEDIFCPLCDYNLRGLLKPRCPECGYRFDWPELLDPSRRVHPYLFEHHPECNERAFRRTLWGGLRPKRFWTSLHPAQPLHPRRLVLYWLIVLGIVLATHLAAFVPAAIDLASDFRFQRQRWARRVNNPAQKSSMQTIVDKWGSLDAFLDDFYPPPASWAFVRRLRRYKGALSGTLAALTIACLTWPLFTLAALLVFQWSMRRARVNPRHVLRCVVYSYDVVIWVLLAVLGIALARALLVGAGVWWCPAEPVLWMELLFVFPMAERLYVSFRWYLRFDHPVATVAASQVIAFLTALNLVVLLYLIL